MAWPVLNIRVREVNKVFDFVKMFMDATCVKSSNMKQRFGFILDEQSLYGWKDKMLVENKFSFSYADDWDKNSSS